MCGIFGVVSTKPLGSKEIKLANRLFKSLADLSTSRGQEASGCAIALDNKIEVYKSS